MSLHPFPLDPNDPMGTHHRATYTDYLKAVPVALKDHPEWRQGQAFFNVLARVNSPLAERVRGSLVDPFYSDEIIPEFLAHCEAVWKEQ